MIKKITIQKIILKYYALNRTHVSRKFQTSNCHDKWTNNDFAARFDFAHRITKWRGDTFYKSKHVWTQIQFLGNIIRNVSSLEQNINDRPKKVNNKHARRPSTRYIIYTFGKICDTWIIRFYEMNT